MMSRKRKSWMAWKIRWTWVLAVVLWNVTWAILPSEGQTPINRITIDNQSGQYALVKVVGPTKVVAKVPLDQKRSVHVAEGEYYILVRYGFSPKEFIYTKGELFPVTQEGNKYSITTITLNRVVAGMKNPYEVSGEEFENFRILKKETKPSSESTEAVSD